MYTVWHVHKYKITFKLVIIHWTNEILQHIVVSSGPSRSGTGQRPGGWETLIQSTRYSCRILIKLEFSWQIIKNYSNTKFHDNPPSGRQVVPCRQRHTHWQTQRSYLVVVFLNFSYAPKNDLLTDNKLQTNGSDLPTSYMGVHSCSVRHTEICTVIRDKHMLGAETNIKLCNLQTATNHTQYITILLMIVKWRKNVSYVNFAKHVSAHALKAQRLLEM